MRAGGGVRSGAADTVGCLPDSHSPFFSANRALIVVCVQHQGGTLSVGASDGNLSPLCLEASDAAAASKPPKESHWRLLGKSSRLQEKSIKKRPLFLPPPFLPSRMVPCENVTVGLELSSHLPTVREVIPETLRWQRGKAERCLDPL